MESFKNRYIITKFSKVSRTGKPGRACTDYGYLLSVRLSCLSRLEAMFSCPVRYKTLQLSDGNRLSLDTADTNAFTLCLLRTYSSANSR